MHKDTRKLIEWLDEASRQIEEAHEMLDELGAKTQADGTALTLAARIYTLARNHNIPNVPR